jgi:carbon monoxide dehydrogenase subunit G
MIRNRITSARSDVSIYGTIANLANRMMGGLTKKLSGEFFNCVKSQIEQ